MLLWFKNKAARTSHRMPIPWAAINNALPALGAPVLGINDEESYNSFEQRVQSSQGALQNIINDGVSYNERGIVFNAPNQVDDLVNDQEVIDQSHSQVKSMAQSELSRSKK